MSFSVCLLLLFLLFFFFACVCSLFLCKFETNKLSFNVVYLYMPIIVYHLNQKLTKGNVYSVTFYWVTLNAVTQPNFFCWEIEKSRNQSYTFSGDAFCCVRSPNSSQLNYAHNFHFKSHLDLFDVYERQKSDSNFFLVVVFVVVVAVVGGGINFIR